MNQTAAEIRTDFLEWSGGFSPESGHQITVYVDYTLSAAADPTFARRVLEAWMQEDAAAEHSHKSQR